MRKGNKWISEDTLDKTHTESTQSLCILAAVSSAIFIYFFKLFFKEFLNRPAIKDLADTQSVN